MKYKHLIKNKIKFFTITLCAYIFFIIIFLPNNVFGASITSSSESAVSAGDTSIINVYLDTQGEVINSIDGSILLSDENNNNFEVKDISLVNSTFTIWPRKPSLEEGGRIFFIGGVPGGVNDNNLLLFKVIVKLNESGSLSIKPSNMIAYLNDGLGTPRDVTGDTSSIIVGSALQTSQDKWEEVISSDNIAPEPFEVNLIQDPNLYEGRKFISFETTDDQSGINYYEVKEGDYPSVRSGTHYILIDQSDNKEIVVTAYDKAGNFQVSVFKAKEPIHWLSIIISVILLVFIYKIFKRIRRKKKNVK